MQQCEAVLQLVPEAVRPRRLVGRRPAPEATRGRLVERLPVHHQVELLVRGADLDGAEQIAPEVGAAREGVGAALRIAVARDEHTSFLERGGLAEKEADLG